MFQVTQSTAKSMGLKPNQGLIASGPHTAPLTLAQALSQLQLHKCNKLLDRAQSWLSQKM